MASIRKVDYFVLKTRNRAGEGARLLKALKQHRVNLLALTAFPDMGGAQVDFIPQKPAAFRAAARKLGLKVSKARTGFLMQGTDKVGALAGVFDRLGRAGINVTAVDAVTAGFRRFGAIFWVKKKDVARAARVLGARR